MGAQNLLKLARTALLLGSVCNCFLAFCEEGSSIHGIVTDDFGQPLSDVCVTLTRLAASGTSTIDVHTNSSGQFTFRQLISSEYNIHAKKPGYADLATLGTSFTTDALSRTADEPVKIVLARLCTIAGFLTGSDGTPVRNAKVVALVSRIVNGKQTFVLRGSPAISDDRGHFRVYSLPPARYTVAVLQKSRASSSVAALFYYPGVPRAAEARTFDLTAGEALTDINLELLDPQMPGQTISGVVTNAGSEDTPSSFAVALASIDCPFLTLGTESASKDGTFAFHGVPPGEYEVVGYGPTLGVGPFGPSMTQGQLKEGVAAISVEYSDKNEVTLALSEGSSVEITAAFEGIRPPNACDLLHVHLMPVSLPPALNLDRVATLTRECRTSIHNVLYGDYDVSLPGLPPPYFLAGIQNVGSGSPPISITGNTQITLLLSDRYCNIDGIAITDTMLPASFATILLAAVGGTNDQVRATWCDKNGHFRFRQIVPGTYAVIPSIRQAFVDLSNASTWAQLGAQVMTFAPATTISLTVHAR
jgi:Carboxypeptidase regulatory-like domain